MSATTPILTTKLYRPRTRADLVARPHLLNKLTEAARRPLTLVSAPAGFGKSTLLAAWLEESGGRVAWVSLDEGDNDPIRFWTYCIAALQTVEPALGADLRPVLLAPQLPAIETILTPLLNDLAAQSEPITLVLDDYHVIDAAAIHEAITFLIEHLPPLTHLVIAGRTNPPLPLSRLRARGQLAEIRAADLRFSGAEVAHLVQEVVGQPLSAPDLAALEARTEGWVAGLQLAGLSLRARSDVSGFIQAFTGSHAYIIDYLVEEVLQRLPAETERFLIQTAVLDRLCGPLCEAVTGAAGAQRMLEQFERDNLFLIPLDTQRQWYRYHNLFADVLRHRLRQVQPALVAELHLRAARWLADNGWLPEAISHAFAAQVPEEAACLIEREAEATLMRGEYMTLQGWLGRLPEAVFQAHPRLCLFWASSLIITHDLEAAQRWLALAETAAGAEATPVETELLAEVAAIRAGIALNRGDFGATRASAEQALAALPERSQRLRGEVMLHLGLAQSWSLNPAAAVQAYAEAGRLALVAGDLHTALLALFNQGSQHFMQGRLQQAAATYRNALQIAAEQGAARIPITSALHRGLAELHYEWNELESAATHLQEALERGERGGLPRVMVLNDLALARLCFARGESAAALSAIDQALRLAEVHELPPRYASPPAAFQARLWLALGDQEAAAAWARAADLDLMGERNYLYEAEYITLARVHLAQGRPGEAQALLAQLRAEAAAVQRVNSIIEILVVETLAWVGQGDRRQAGSVLERAVRLGLSGGYVRTFVDEGTVLQQVLGGLRTGVTEPALLAYIDRLCAAFAPLAEAVATPAKGTAPAPGLPPGVEPLIEPLSERELEVLRFVATGLSDRQVAETMIVAIGTVKRHLNNIYGKLGVHSRTQALARARDLGLL
jgi:LuxR family transcriptional regulator, maltose regulon positive regulatory protein